MFRNPPNVGTLDKAIDRVLTVMEGLQPESDAYAKMVNQLVKLHALKVAERPKRVSNDTLITVAANLISLLLILNYERTQVITSRAVNFIPKIR